MAFASGGHCLPRVPRVSNPEKPAVSIPSEDPPAGLVVEDLVEGDGSEATAGDTVMVHYVGVAWSTGQQFDASWDRNETFDFRLGAGQWHGTADVAQQAVQRGVGQDHEGAAVGGQEVLLPVVERLGRAEPAEPEGHFDARCHDPGRVQPLR